MATIEAIHAQPSQQSRSSRVWRVCMHMGPRLYGGPQFAGNFFQVKLTACMRINVEIHSLDHENSNYSLHIMCNMHTTLHCHVRHIWLAVRPKASLIMRVFCITCSYCYYRPMYVVVRRCRHVVGHKMIMIALQACHADSLTFIRR